MLFYTSKALITSRAEDIRVDQLASVQLSFRAIGFQDERRPELADGVQDKAENKQPKSRLQETAGNVANKLRNFGF